MNASPPSDAPKTMTSEEQAEIDELEWDNTVITTAWSRAQSSRTGRVGRTFGNRGKKGPRTFGIAKPVLQKSFSAVEDTITSGSSGYIVDSSPELSSRSSGHSFFSESQGSSTSAASSSTVADLFNSKPQRQQLRHHRSMSMYGSMPSMTNKQQPRRFSSRRLISRSATITTIDSQNMFGAWEENSNPNFTPQLDDVEKEHRRERKKRCARRHSIQHSAPFSEQKPPPVRPDALSWLPSQQESSSRLQRLEPKVEFDVRDLSEAPAYPSPEPSVSSSRKRGVCESPPRDSYFPDDWGSNSCSSLNLSLSLMSAGSSRRRRSRIFQQDPADPDLPFAPALASTTQPPPLANGYSTRRCMDVDSDDGDDEESSAAPSSVNQSFTSVSSLQQPPPQQFKLPQSNSTQENKDSPDFIFETMSSYEDLKFLIKALRKESNGKLAMSSFGGVDSWNVPPPNAWSSERRSAFFQWTKTHLGFTVRAVGGAALTYLQIPRSKGVTVLENLEAALVQYKEQCIADNQVKEQSMPSQIVCNDTTLLTAKLTASVVAETRYVLCPLVTCLPPMHEPQSFRLSSKSTLTPSALMSPMDTSPPCDVTSDLAIEMESLTFKESSSKKPLVRQVTLPPKAPDDAEEGKSRPSLDHHVPTNDLMSHLHGLSPNGAPDLKPPKLSLGSLGTTNARPGRLSTSSGAETPSFRPFAALQNMEIVGT